VLGWDDLRLGALRLQLLIYCAVVDMDRHRQQRFVCRMVFVRCPCKSFAAGAVVEAVRLKVEIRVQAAFAHAGL